MSKIVIRKPDGVSQVIRDKPFDLERVLQEDIQSLPEVIPLEDALGQPVGLLPIGMEVQVGSGAIDILMVDSTGVVTIVETKLAKNPESRREVVGQVLEMPLTSLNGPSMISNVRPIAFSTTTSWRPMSTRICRSGRPSRSSLKQMVRRALRLMSF